MISRCGSRMCDGWCATFCSFQSRNRGSFDFKLAIPCKDCFNLERFDFKSFGCSIKRFNLVIEVLLISSQNTSTANRGSFDFKCDRLLNGCFNLVIEVLLISSISHQYPCQLTTPCFNLVIEVLLISRWRQGR